MWAHRAYAWCAANLNSYRLMPVLKPSNERRPACVCFVILGEWRACLSGCLHGQKLQERRTRLLLGVLTRALQPVYINTVCDKAFVFVINLILWWIDMRHRESEMQSTHPNKNRNMTYSCHQNISFFIKYKTCKLTIVWIICLRRYIIFWILLSSSFCLP